MNNYDFWESYLKDVKLKLLELVKIKKKISIDLHIHSNYSADGKQTLDEIIKSTNNLGFDIISITDHDNLDVYDELYNIVNNGITNPIIIPGIEFTIDNSLYGSQCHLLQLFINPKDKDLINNVKKNYMATFNRSKIQFLRLKNNLDLQEIFRDNHIKVSSNEYFDYLEKNNLVPEYNTICDYLMSKFKIKGITNYDILNKLVEYNYLDTYIDRRLLKEKRYDELKVKYKYNKDNFYSTRFLLSLLAVKNVDDDWWNPPWSGSLSVNSYGQLKVEELNNKYITIFAHPTETKLDIVEDIIRDNKNIRGIEFNIRNDYYNIELLINLKNKYKLFKTIGSDSHDNSLKFYNNVDYFSIDSDDLLEIIGTVYGRDN